MKNPVIEFYYGVYIMKKACLVCGCEFETNYKIKKYCSEKCRMFAKNNRTRSGCQCVICGHKAEVLTKHLKAAHNLTPDEYCTIYKIKKSDVVSDGMSKKLSDVQKNSELCVANRFSSKNNPAKGHSGRYSPYSMNFIRYDGMSDEEKKRAIAEVRERKQKSVRENPQNQPTRIEFYTSRGLSPDEARKALSERQRTFSLEKCIERYGDDEGMRVWKERQERWQETLNSKSEDEKEEIKKKKLNGLKASFSNPERDLFETLKNKFSDEVEAQYKIYSTKHNYSFDIRYKNKIIEFNGDYWHCNPKKYKSDDIVKFPYGIRKVKEVWDEDAEKIRTAKENGFDVLVVWESDYEKDKEKEIVRCIKHLKDD